MLFQSISGIRIIWEVSVNTMARHLNSSGTLHSLMHHRASRAGESTPWSLCLTSSQAVQLLSQSCIHSTTT